MKAFGGPAILLDRDDINTDEIIPAKYLTEITKTALRTHLLEDLLLDGQPFNSLSREMSEANVVVTRANFGCGSSREHAVWAFEVNDINVIIAESFARIFRQNMFNCGIMAIELNKTQIDSLFAMQGNISFDVNIEIGVVKATSDESSQMPADFEFQLNPFDMELVKAGGWLSYADQNY